MTPSTRPCLILVGAALLSVCCGAAQPASRPGGERGGGTVSRVTSNILRSDYAGSDSCAACHGEIHAAWKASPMHLMTRTPETARIRAPFDGATFHFKDDAAVLSRRDDARFVRIRSARDGNHLYRVTRVIGGRYREDFAGVEVAEERAEAPAVGSKELLLPVSYVFETASFRLKGYSVLVGERPGLRAGGVWSETCIFCHNTTPYFDSLWGELHGRGAPSYQGEVVDRLLPADRRWRVEPVPGGEAAMLEAVAREVSAVGGAPSSEGGAADGDRRTVLAHGIRTLKARFEARHFIEVGIGCEACHGGSREHVTDPHVLPDFAPRSRFLEARPDTGATATRAEQINRVCARCHQVLFSRYPFTWEGGQRRGGTAGGSSITTGEARDFLLGGCARQMSCVTCHDPHAEDRRAELDRLGTVAGNSVCVRCHGQYAAPAALAAHAHHDPAGAGASCIGCHMPRKNMGLGYALTRYHRIGRPDDPARVERDRPLECALCHADKTVGQLVGTMEGWWGRSYSRAVLADLYGSLDARPLEATLMRGKAHEQATAVAALAEAGQKQAAPAVARLLVNPFPLVRYYARRALETLHGPCSIDLERSSADVAAAARGCINAEYPEFKPAAARGTDVPDED